MSEQEVSLQNLMQPSRTVEFDFPGYRGFKVKLCYLAREELLKLRKKCITKKFDRKTHRPVEDFDDEKFLDLFCSEVIKGWSGLKYRYLEELLLVDTTGYDPDDEVPFTQDNAHTLMTNSPDFDSWVTSMVEDLQNFTKAK